MKTFIQIYFLILLGSTCLLAQSRTELESKRQTLNKEIEKANQKLSETASVKNAALKKLHVLKKEIGSRDEVIQSLAQTVEGLNVMLSRKMVVTEALGDDAAKLKDHYKKLVRQLYRHKVSQSPLLFLLSAKSFNEAYQRWIYLQHLEKKRSVQAGFILRTQNDLAGGISKLEIQKAAQNGVLIQEAEQKQKLDKERRAHDEMVSELRKKEFNLRANLDKKKRIREQLNQKIEETIRKQIAAAKAAERQYQAKNSPNASEIPFANNNNSTTTNPILKNLSSKSAASQAFAKQKGKLMSPIYMGEIVGFFGRHQHPLFKDVITVNNGIDIKGQYNSVVRSVFEGEVVSIFAIPGFGNAVMLKHGDYYTTYSNVAQVYVKKGDVLKTSAQIGSIGRDNNAGGHILHFEIWHDKEKENPSAWIGKK